jgi:hypothetical protein
LKPAKPAETHAEISGAAMGITSPWLVDDE